MILSVLSYYEHTRTTNPSTTIETYLLLSVAFDAVQIRSLWLQQDMAIAVVLMAGLVTKTCLLCLESISKRSFLNHPYNQVSAESASGIFGRSFFYWLNGLLFLGSRSVLSLKDLPSINESLRSKNLYEQSKSRLGKGMAPTCGIRASFSVLSRPRPRKARIASRNTTMFQVVAYTCHTTTAGYDRVLLLTAPSH